MSRSKRDTLSLPAWCRFFALCAFSAPLAIATGVISLALLAGLVAWDVILGGFAIKD